MGKAYAVTGANRGLGLEVVRQLLSDPANTVIAAVRSLKGDLTDLEALKSTSPPGRLQILECDTSSPSSISAFGASLSTEAVLGPAGQLHYLINNAGINIAREQTSLDLAAAALHEHIDVNVLGPALTVQAVLPHLHRGSVVVNMSSGLGSIHRAATQLYQCASYSISKAALNMLTVHQAGDLRERGVRVVCVDPGWVKTRMGGSNAALEPEASISGVLKLIHALKDTDTAKFYTYTGDEMPW